MRKKTKKNLKWALGATLAFLALAAGLSLLEAPNAPHPQPIKPQVLHVQVQDAPPPPPAEKPSEREEPAPALPPVPEAPHAPPSKTASAHGHIALVIDDMGVAPTLSARAMALPSFVTLSFLPYATHLADQTAKARKAGHPLMLHLPMQPKGGENPGPGALLTSLPPDKNAERLQAALVSFSGYVGVNNHMGSAFTERGDLLRPVMVAMKERNLFFLDSMTGPHSVAKRVAEEEGVPTAARDVFIDDSPAPAAIRGELAKLEKRAAEKGEAIAIGHPRLATLSALEAWIPSAEARGIVFVPVSELMR